MIFIDTSAFVGLHVAQDTHHGSALAAFRRLKREGLRTLTSNLVIAEALGALARIVRHSHAVEVAAKLARSSRLEILRTDARDERKAHALFGALAKHEVSFIDCTSIVLMRGHGIRDILSYDKDFEHANEGTPEVEKLALWPPR